METIDLSKFEPQEMLNHTSKGNQLKWKCDGYWYKADHMGYEGLAETIVSDLLTKSTVQYPFVAYEYVTCFCCVFLLNDYQPFYLSNRFSICSS